MNRRVLFFLAGFSSVALASPKLHEPARAPAPLITSELNGSDVEFLSSTADCGLIDVKLGELAALRAETSEIKSLGDAIAKDQREAGSELQKLAEKKGLPVRMRVDSQQ